LPPVLINRAGGFSWRGRKREIVLKRETIPAYGMMERGKRILTISRPKPMEGDFTGAG